MTFDVAVRCEHVPLRDLAADVRYGYTASASDEPVGPRFLRITDIVGDNLDWNTVPYCEAVPDAVEKFQLAPGDIVIARTGATVGTTHYCHPPEPTVFASYLVRFRIDQKRADARFVSYVLRSPSWWNFVAGAVTGSAQPQMNAQAMGSFMVPAPPVPDQIRIAAVLSALDDKIDSNRRLAALLEETAATLFKARFVDFVGVEEFEDSEIGPVDDEFELLGGGTPKTSINEYWNGEIPWISVKDIGTGPYVLTTKKTVSQLAVDHRRVKLYSKGTAVISARGTVGTVGLMAEPMTVNQSCYAVEGRRGIGQIFVYFRLLQIVDELQVRSHGSVFSTITRDTFSSIRVRHPTVSQLAEFDAAARPIFAQILELMHETLGLTEIRDALLPKLISGAIRVPDTTDVDEVIGPLVEAVS